MAAFPVGRSFTQAALDGVSRAGLAAVDMRYFAARESAPDDYCRQRVRECEVYVAVIGFRYGSLVPETRFSYTEAEFREAGAAGIPRLVFLLDENVRLPDGTADPDQSAVGLFRRRLGEAGLILARFTTPADLELRVFQALTETAALLCPAVTGPRIRHSLPPDTAAFTGREAELKRIISAATTTASDSGAVAIRAISGMPGAGKTALAVHAAHLLAERFPDRQLFIDLHAHTPGREPLAPHDALGRLLAASGVDPRFMPGDLDGRTAMWRDKMADAPALLVLDNAASSAQVAPLLPGGGSCLVLVTSRRHLGDLPGADAPISLDILPAEQAEEMLTRLAPRAATDPDGPTEVAGLAGCLPLAISLLARVFARHPSWTLADLAAETRNSLLTVKAENETIAAAFDVSFRHLDPAQQRFFDFLGLHPGTTIESCTAAALADISPAEAGERLEALHGEGLVTETGPRRYGQHNLLRRYARDHAAVGFPASQEENVIGRLLDFYQHTATRAQDQLARQTQSRSSHSRSAAGAAPPVDDARQALAWMRAERESLLACLARATRTGQHTRVIALTAALAELLRRDGPWTEAIAHHETAVQAADYVNDRPGGANALTNLGIARRLTGDYRGATEDLEQALAAYRDLDDRLGQAHALDNLGVVRQLRGDNRGAAGDLEQALTIYRDLGNKLGQASARTNLGTVRRGTGDCPGAIEDLNRALSIYLDLGNKLGQASVLRHLGAVRSNTGEYLEAARDLEQAFTIYLDLGDRLGQANALRNLGAVRELKGDYPGAVEDLEQALAVYLDLGDRNGQANARVYLGGVKCLTGNYRGAVDDLEQALATYQGLGNPNGQANALNGLGMARRGMGDYLGAAKDLEQALGLYRDIGNRDGQAEVLNETGALHRVIGGTAAAEACYQQALELARAVGGAQREAQALLGLGHCAATVGQVTRARVLLRQAQHIFQRIGAADAPAVLAELELLAE